MRAVIITVAIGLLLGSCSLESELASILDQGSAVSDGELPCRVYTPDIQFLSFLAGLVIKPIYMILCLIVILFIRSRDNSLRMLRLGLILFLTGEGICALNFLFASGASEALDILHDLGMVAMGVLVPWGLLALLDDRVFGFFGLEQRCSFQKLCGQCWKKQDVKCNLNILFRWLAPALAIVSLLPLASPLRTYDFMAMVYDTDVRFTYGVEMQFINFRIFPIIAALSFAGSMMFLFSGPQKQQGAKALFFVGFGFMSFSLFRYFLVWAFRDQPVWLEFWEELTEFMAIALVALFLWYFRTQLGLPFGQKAGSG